MRPISAQAIDRQTMNSGEQPAIAPLSFLNARMELAAKGEAFTLQRCERDLNFRCRDTEKRGQGSNRHRTTDLETATNQLPKCCVAIPNTCAQSFRNGDLRFNG